MELIKNELTNIKIEESNIKVRVTAKTSKNGKKHANVQVPVEEANEGLKSGTTR